VLHGWSGDPVDSRITSDSLVERIDEDDFIVLECGVLIDPIRVENSQVSAFSSDSFFGNTSDVSSEFELVDSLILGLSHGLSLSDGSLSASSSDSDSVDDESLFGLVSQSSSLVWSGGSSYSVDGGKLSIFETSDSEDESDDIRLFLFCEF